MSSVFEAAPINDQIFRFERENELDTQFEEDENAEGQSTDLCKFYFSDKGCSRGARCQFRHARNDRLIVCKHWLRALCKKGEFCEYLHEFDKSKMPECFFFSKFGECSNAECMYRHVDPDKKRNECPYYARGFCKHGPKCRLRHVKREACHDYLFGFCKSGPDCAFGHARFEIPRVEDDEDGPGGIDRFGFGRPKPAMPNPRGSGGDDAMTRGPDGNPGDGGMPNNGRQDDYRGKNNSRGGYGGRGNDSGQGMPGRPFIPNMGGDGNVGFQAHKSMGGMMNMPFDPSNNDMRGGGMGGGGRPPIVCHHCRQPGHIRPKCPLRAAQNGNEQQGGGGGGDPHGGGMGGPVPM